MKLVDHRVVVYRSFKKRAHPVHLCGNIKVSTEQSSIQMAGSYIIVSAMKTIAESSTDAHRAKYHFIAVENVRESNGMSTNSSVTTPKRVSKVRAHVRIWIVSNLNPQVA